ncbi:urate hydroxylase PuuD [Vibrio sp. M260118]|uniref:urate hydroxylase PuuD n=1 Tax=Vibrio sp. M260118 TaxID=3020896 RepID=UPI002F4160DA
MWPQLYEWIALFIKWFHVICGVAWIGASFYFTWLDNSLETPPKWKKDKGIKGDLWAVHGGGFYEVAKYQVGPEKMPENLHWFKWEAYTTWLTGTALLIWMYYFNAQAYLIDPRIMPLSSLQAVMLGIGGVIAGVITYELLLRSSLSSSKPLFVASVVLAGCAFFYGFSQVFSGRGAFIHMGVLIGSIMVNNVFYKIIPGQRKMVAQVVAGENVDPQPGLEGKRRSIHNNYFTLPIIFLMISNHYPMFYQHANNWLIAILVMILSAWIRHYFNLRHVGLTKPSVLISGSLAMFMLAIVVSLPINSLDKNDNVSNAKAMIETADTDKHQLKVMTIIERRCTTCHSQTPTDDVFSVAPAGASFDNWQDVQRWSTRIVARTVENEDMPFMNKTGMTKAERLEIGKILAN